METKVDKRAKKILTGLMESYPKLKIVQDEITEAYFILEKVFLEDRYLFVAGNGGSSCDSGHIVGELMKGFMKKREVLKSDIVKPKGVDDSTFEILSKGLQYGMRAVDLSSQQGLISAISNDNGAQLIYAQQVWSYGKKDDVFLGLSTSGNSKNVILAGVVAKSKGMKTIGLSGDQPSKMDGLFDVVIKAPSSITPKIQELHLPIYHALCAMLEEKFYG